MLLLFRELPIFIGILTLMSSPANGGLTKLLVGPGIGDNGVTKDVEILDLEEVDSTCSAQDYPFAVYGTVGGLDQDGKPIICGGSGDGPSVYHSDCFTLVEGTWENRVNMTEPRAYAALLQSPFDDDHQLLVTGGGSSGVGLEGISSTAESLTTSGWGSSLPELPVKIYFHCMVSLNATAIMVIGGALNYVDPASTFIFNNDTYEWTSGPNLKYGRHHHSCARVFKNKDEDSVYSIVVAGGVNGTAMSSVEILDEGDDTWKEGPELPFGIYRSELVEDGKGGVILVGGQKEDQHYLDSLYSLKDGDKSWNLMDKKLKIARSFHTAFLVSDCPHVAEKHVAEHVAEHVTETHADEEPEQETSTTMSATSEKAAKGASTASEEEEDIENTTILN